MARGTTVKELIQELLECEMDSIVNLKIKLSDTDWEYEDGEVGIEVIKTGGGWGKNTAYITLDLETQSTEELADELKGV